MSQAGYTLNILQMYRLPIEISIFAFYENQTKTNYVYSNRRLNSI